MDTIKLNIALRFEDEILQEIADTMSELDGRYETKYIVDNQEYIPHITLFQGLFPSKNIDGISQLLRDIAGNTTSFTLKVRNLNNFKSSIWVNFIKSPETLNLHDKITDGVQEFREGLVEPQFEKTHPVYQSLTITRRKMADEFGYPHVKEMFEPHISLMKLVDRELVYVVLDRINWRIREIPIKKLAIYEAGEEGVCKKVIEEFELA